MRDGTPLQFQLAQLADAAGGEGGGRLIHDDDADFLREGLGDFDDLLFLGASISRYALEGYREKCDTSVKLGTRFASNPPYPNGANYLVAVKYTGGQWTYDNNGTYEVFTALSSDVLLAEVDFTADTVTDLKGTASGFNGIALGV